jgi:hypothetical protein
MSNRPPTSIYRERIMFKIEKNLPVPPPAEKVRMYPFLDMEVGDSFAYPSNTHHTVRSSMYSYTRNTTMKFSFRKLGEESRCWRVK